MEHRSPGAGFSRVRFEELSRLVWRRFHLDSPVRFAALVGMLAGLVSVAGLLERGGYAGDFTWAWRAARLWLAGRDPYLDPGLHPIFPYPFDAPLLYPMPAVVIALPFALLPAWMAGTAFFALSAGTLAYVIARTEPMASLAFVLECPFLCGRNGGAMVTAHRRSGARTGTRFPDSRQAQYRAPDARCLR